jgi:hypothetical protein
MGCNGIGKDDFPSRSVGLCHRARSYPALLDQGWRCSCLLVVSSLSQYVFRKFFADRLWRLQRLHWLHTAQTIRPTAAC